MDDLIGRELLAIALHTNRMAAGGTGPCFLELQEREREELRQAADEHMHGLTRKYL